MYIIKLLDEIEHMNSNDDFSLLTPQFLNFISLYYFSFFHFWKKNIFGYLNCWEVITFVSVSFGNSSLKENMFSKSILWNFVIPSFISLSNIYWFWNLFKSLDKSFFFLLPFYCIVFLFKTFQILCFFV